MLQLSLYNYISYNSFILTALVKSVLIRGKDVDVGITSAYGVITIIKM